MNIFPSNPEFDRRTHHHPAGLKQSLRTHGSAAPTPEQPVNVGSLATLALPPLANEPTREQDAAAVLERTRGRRVVFVGNRTDERLREALVARFAFARLDWCEAAHQRLDALCRAVAAGRYDIVIAATGFIGHAAERKLLPAARRVGVPYVRANRGRAGACMRALVRDLGVHAELASARTLEVAQ